MKNTLPIFKGGFLLALVVFASGCIVVPEEGHYDRDHHRYYHEHGWHDCGEHDERCR